VTGHVTDDSLERAAELRSPRNRRMLDRAGGELDAIPGQDIGGYELRERAQRAAPQFLLRVGGPIERANLCAATTSLSTSHGMTAHP
jgi:hypothetical protein